MYISRFSGAPLFPHTRKADEGPEGWVAFSAAKAAEAAEAGGEAGTSLRMLQHVRAETPAGSLRTELFDAVGCGPSLGFAMGAPAGPAAGALQASDAQLLLVDETALLWVPSGAHPPAAVPLPAAPAIRSLLAAAPEWMGVAYVVTLAGGPPPAPACTLVGCVGGGEWGGWPAVLQADGWVSWAGRFPIARPRA